MRGQTWTYGFLDAGVGLNCGSGRMISEGLARVGDEGAWAGGGFRGRFHPLPVPI